MTDAPNATVLERRLKDSTDQQAGEVRFQDVSFSYEAHYRADAGGLRALNFSIAPGQTIAFIGASGSGKR